MSQDSTKQIVVVMTHGCAGNGFRQNEPYWMAQSEKLIVVCPTDDPVQTRHETLMFAKSSHAGAETWKRLRITLDELATREWDHCCIHEWDSLFLRSEPMSNGFRAILFANAESPRYMAPIYGLPPWSMDRESFNAMHAKARMYPALFEGGFLDRYLAAIAMLAGVPIMDYAVPGYGRAPIRLEDYQEVRRAILAGTSAIHGIKTPDVLELIERSHGDYLNALKL